MTRARETANQVSYITAKGDLLAGTSAGIQAKIGIGADYQIPVADSSVSTNIRWADDYQILDIMGAR